MLSVALLVGFITLFGIATRNGIVLVSHVRHLAHEAGVTDPHEAVLRSVRRRLTQALQQCGGGACPVSPAAPRRLRAERA